MPREAIANYYFTVRGAYPFCHCVLLQDSGTIVLSMDALFGLPRKKSAGRSFRDPLHGDLFFGNQASVDEYVCSVGTKKIQSVSYEIAIH